MIIIRLFLILLMIYNSVSLKVSAMEPAVKVNLSSQDLNLQLENILKTKETSSKYAYSIIKMACHCNNQQDIKKLLRLAGEYKSFGHIEMNIFSLGNYLTNVSTVNTWEDNLSNAIRSENIKNIALILSNKRAKIYQEHLILAIFLKKLSVAKTLVYLGADIETKIFHERKRLTVASYAQEQNLLKLVNLIESRISPKLEPKESLFGECFTNLMAKLSDIVDLFE